ncbi:hypothetical protein MRB53_015320 [Persea americana]|uniref:Uncharacterized protein n=1 Tax=Persea americana TaxID=3435 RepID=A0ACC2KD98_PERAE|nr:hypothetical protein MRB53_015320 [Persea americana]
MPQPISSPVPSHIHLIPARAEPGLSFHSIRMADYGEDLSQIDVSVERALPSYVINEAKEKLSRIFGYELKELQRASPSTNRRRSSQQSAVDLKSCHHGMLHEPIINCLEDHDYNRPHLSFLAFLICLWFGRFRFEKGLSTATSRKGLYFPLWPTL